MMISKDWQAFDDFFDRYPIRSYRKGYMLVLAGDVTPKAFYLVSGRVRVYDVTYRGDERIVYDIKAPALVPLLFLLDIRPTPYIYEAHTDIEVRQAPADEVMAFVRTHSDVAFELLLTASRVLNGVLERTMRILSGSAKERLIYSLVMECRRYGERQRDGSYRVAISERELGAQAGLSRETISREARKLKADHLIEVGHHEITIPNLEQLEHVIELDV